MSEKERDIKFSCVTPTFRSGGVDILVNGLKDQEFSNFECIFVDERYHERKEAVREFVAQQGLSDRFIHVPPKKRDQSRPVGLGNARNTGLLLSEGEYIVTLDDYTLLQPYCLKRFNRMTTELGAEVHLAIRRVYENPPIQNPEGKITTYKNELNDVDHLDYELHDIYRENVGVVEVDTFKYVLGLGCIPLDAMLAIEGYDERYDNGHGVENADLLFRLSQIGLDIYMDSDNINAHIEHPTQPMPGTSDNMPIYRERQRSGEIKAKNPFNFSELRSELLPYKTAISKGEEPPDAPLKWDDNADFHT